MQLAYASKEIPCWGFALYPEYGRLGDRSGFLGSDALFAVLQANSTLVRFFASSTSSGIQPAVHHADIARRYFDTSQNTAKHDGGRLRIGRDVTAFEVFRRAPRCASFTDLLACHERIMSPFSWQRFSLFERRRQIPCPRKKGVRIVEKEIAAPSSSRLRGGGRQPERRNVTKNALGCGFCAESTEKHGERPRVRNQRA